ncbi:hypothetical protein HBI56_235370 [Parastagonospora nodorum]|nr:hypothetical protein HBH46_234790 [Parastagonospora nodorum]KAH4334446.1 hypothetical protein HBH98_241070 [Parastagonospora nodorum]KAH4355676.1 hypothetical protein HBH97_235720 [Parastagonospora nodorum]KAH4375446.1 hypothetical protein HBH99_215070 [Parastagonospora nodorum]KAH4891441.1 hypothetical protein HBH74_224240 [Parastagonospora nodorum]
MSLYEYQPLEHWDSVRLVILHPAAQSSDPIRCSLQHARLTENPKYEAISYTWGNTSAPRSLYVGGKDDFLKSTKNCSNALRALRLVDGDRVVWIDAVCINQADTSERGHQVKSMNMIYEMASTVVIYLGEDTRGSRRLFKELATREMELSETGKCSRQPPSDFIVSELEILIERPWFRRIWVLQEVSGNTSLTVMCGSVQTSLEILEACLHGYQGHRVIEDSVPLPILLWSRQKLKVEEHLDAPRRLWHQIISSRRFLATDPRDKIFALRSLLPKAQRNSMDHLIDYDATKEQTFIKTVLFLLPSIGLHLLTANRHPHDLHMPSWIPDLSQSSPLDSWSPYKSISEIPASFTVVSPNIGENQLRLHVKGLSYATIRKTSRPWKFRDMIDTERQMIEFFNTLPTLAQLIYASPDDNNEYGSYHCDTELLQALILEAREDARAFGWDLQRGYCRGYQQHSRSATISPREFHESLAECRIVLTDTFELAIAPAAARIGDTVCVFQHGHSPCLLRRHEDQLWKMISGDFYVFRRVAQERGAEFPYLKYCMRRAAEMETFEIC